LRSSIPPAALLSREARTLMTFGPLVGFLVTVASLVVLYDWATVVFFMSAVAGNFLGAGKLVVLMGAVDRAPLGVWWLATFVAASDSGTALILLANVHHLDRLPFVGPRLLAAHTTGERILRNNRWLRNLADFGVALFVAFPFQGTGAVLGVVLARLVGMSWASTWAAITAGAATGAYLLALAGEAARRPIDWLAERPLLGSAVIIFCLVVTAILGRLITGRPPSDSEHDPT
jgi:hypothetical protein